MATTLRWLQRHFWVPMTAAMVFGLLIPDIGNELKPTFKLAILIILTLVFTKIDMGEVLTHIKSPKLMLYLLALKLVIVPLLFYVVLRLWLPDLAIGVLLLLAVPPAAAAPVFTDLVKGNTPLCVSLYILSYILAPLSVTFVMGLTGLAHLDLFGLFRTITLLIFGPLLLAQLAKKFIPTVIARTSEHYGSINLIVVTYLIFAIVSASSRHFRMHLGWMIWVTLFMYGLFLLLHIAGYMMMAQRPEKDRLAISVSMAYMNTALAVVLAIDFFPKEVVLAAIASEIPWCTMLGPARWLHTKWRGNPESP